jgi:F-type H+-transporting ATPase subunit delta
MSSLANRYARALADAAAAELPEVFAELQQFQALTKTSSDLHEVIVNPTIPLERKESLLQALLERAKPRPTTANFLGVLLRNQRLSVLDSILAALSETIDARNGAVPVEVATAQELGAAAQRTIETRLRTMTGKEVRVTYKTDPDLLGGAVARVGSRYYDGSVRSQLNAFKEKLSRA